MQTKLFRELNRVLKAFPQFWNGEELHRTMVIEAINRKQPEVIKALVSNEKIKSVYGTDIDGIFIFDFGKLCSLLKYKEYWENSFTKYRNKVGLTSEGKYLDYSSDVVLDFPFKDCVLEGGMTKEDQGKDEVYYNEIIARDEIDCLFSPKVLTDAKRYTKDNIEENIIDFHNNDNLIIKGNNLIVLNSLKKRYAGKIKLIYIDPPYNTGTDSFKYNDRFNRSSWLLFMKNRLEIARDLLMNEGVIFVQCDDNEYAYLKVLMDGIFGEENFISSVIWQKKYSPQNDARWFSDNHDFIICYAKNKITWRPNLLERTEKQNAAYKNPDNDKRGPWKAVDFSRKAVMENTIYEIKTPSGRMVSPPKGRSWLSNENKFNELVADDRIWFGESGNNVPALKKFITEVKDGVTPLTIWTYDVSRTYSISKTRINENIT
ncbi:MAG TPA: DNA methyltransferase [Arsenophonus nasoniae]|uniref:DNA methyltransferase n=1 Tax=Arsenophonus nasoniae TaxID=638 RepID=UPI003879DD85